VKKIKQARIALRSETLRTIGGKQLSDVGGGVGGGFQASMVTTACPTCAWSCDWTQCQPPPSN